MKTGEYIQVQLHIHSFCRGLGLSAMNLHFGQKPCLGLCESKAIVQTAVRFRYWCQDLHHLPVQAPKVYGVLLFTWSLDGKHSISLLSFWIKENYATGQQLIGIEAQRTVVSFQHSSIVRLQ